MDLTKRHLLYYWLHFEPTHPALLLGVFSCACPSSCCSGQALVLVLVPAPVLARQQQQLQHLPTLLPLPLQRPPLQLP
jgi:hypothetical protein